MYMKIPLNNDDAEALLQLKVIFDMGRCFQRCYSQPNVLISHAHLDHIGGLPSYLSIRYHLASNSVSTENLSTDPLFN